MGSLDTALISRPGDIFSGRPSGTTSLHRLLSQQAPIIQASKPPSLVCSKHTSARPPVYPGPLGMQPARKPVLFRLGSVPLPPGRSFKPPRPLGSSEACSSPTKATKETIASEQASADVTADKTETQQPQAGSDGENITRHQLRGRWVAPLTSPPTQADANDAAALQALRRRKKSSSQTRK